MGFFLSSFFAEDQKNFYLSYKTVNQSLHYRMDQLSQMLSEIGSREIYIWNPK